MHKGRNNYLYNGKEEQEVMLLKTAAHYNSIANSSTNGYRPQFDSADDQLSIGRGVSFSLRQLLRYRTLSSDGKLSPVTIK